MNESSLSDSWEILFRPHIARFAPLLFPSLTAILTEADMKLQVGHVRGHWDPFGVDGTISSNLRKALSSRDPVSALIRAACDILEWHLAERPKVAEAIVEIWLASEATLLRRLGLYGLERLSSLNADEKVNRLLESGWIALPALGQDLLELFSSAYPKIKTSTRRRLLEAARQAFHLEMESEDPEAQRFADYSLNGILRNLEQVSPEDPLLKKERSRLVKRRPELERQRELESSDDEDDQEGGWVQAISPLGAAELKVLSPASWLESFEEIGRRPLDPSELVDYQQGFLEETEKIAIEDFSYGIAIAEALLDRNDLEHSAWASLFRAWGERLLLESEWQRIISVVDRGPLLAAQGERVIGFLRRWASRRKVNEPSPAQWLSALALAERLWALEGDHPPGIREGQVDFLSVAINSPAGELAEIAIQVTSGLLLDDVAKGIPRPALYLMTQMCAAQDPPRELAVCVLASRFRYLRQLDATWAREHLEPRFDWSNPRHAVQAWHGLLHGNVDSTFIPLFKAAFPHIAEFGIMRDRFVEHVARLAFRSDSDPYQAGWLRSFLEHTSQEDRGHFSRLFGSALERISAEERSELWNHWLGAYFHQRFKHAPPLADTELRAFADWALHLGPLLGEIQQQLVQAKSPLYSQPGVHFFFRLAKGPPDGADPTAVVRLSSWMLRSAVRGQFWEGTYVQKIIETYTDRGAAASALEELRSLLIEKEG